MDPAGETQRGEDREEEAGHSGSASSSDSEPEPPASRYRRVSFADAFGLDLVSVKEFCSRETSAGAAAAVAPPPDDERDYDPPPDPGGPDPEEYFLCSQFSVPASPAELLAKLETQACELELVELLPGSTTLRGIIRVLNLCYDKAVCVRTTLDGWASHCDLPAGFLPGSSDGRTDRFAFTLELEPPIPPEGARVEFCLRYETPLGTFWANNSGVNYVLLCQQRGSRDAKGWQYEDISQRNKKSCLKINSKEQSTEAHTPVISVGNADVPLNEQEVNVRKKTEEPAPKSDGLQDDSCQKSMVESGQNICRRTRRRVARLAQIRDRYRRDAAGRDHAPDQDSWDTDGQEDAESRVVWDWSQRVRKEQVQTGDEIPQQPPEADTEELLLPFMYTTDEQATLDRPREDSQGLGPPSIRSVRWGTAVASERVEDGVGGTTPGAPQGTIWDPTDLPGALWCPDTPQGAPWDTDGLFESAANLSEVATEQESDKSPQAREEAAVDISMSVEDFLDAEDGYRWHSHPASRDGARTDGQDSGLLWPQSERGSDKFKFETFVAPLYHQASCRSRPESQDISRGLWEGEQASDDSDDEGQTGSMDSCSRLSAIANTQPLFPFGSYAPRVHQPGCSSEILASARDNSLSTDTHLSKQEQPVYGQDNATSSSLETNDPGAEIAANSQDHGAVEYGAEIISDGDVLHIAEIGRKDKEHLFRGKAVEELQISEEAETKTDATAMIASLAPSNTNVTEAPGEDCSRITLLPLLAHSAIENKQYELGGDLGEVCVKDDDLYDDEMSVGDEDLDDYEVYVEDEDLDEVSIEDAKLVEDISLENEHLDDDKVPVGDEDLDNDEVYVEDEDLYDDEMSVGDEDLDDYEVYVEYEDRDDDEVSVEDEDLDDNVVSVGDEDLDEVSIDDAKLVKDVTLENERLHDDEVPVADEDLDDDEVSVEDEYLLDDEMFVEDEDLDDDEVSVRDKDLDDDKVRMEGEDLNKNISLGSDDLSGDNLNVNEDLDNEELSVENPELPEDVSVEYDELPVEEEIDNHVSEGDEEFDRGMSMESKGLYSDNQNEIEDLGNEELLMEDAELAAHVSVEQEDVPNDEMSVEEETDKYISVGDEELDKDRSVENKDPYIENLIENDDRLSVENKDLDNMVSLKDEYLDEEVLSMENRDGIDKAGEEAPVHKDLYHVKSETSTGKKEDLYDPEEMFFIERKDEYHDGGNEMVKEREDLDEGVGVGFRRPELDPCTDLKTDAVIGEVIHVRMDRTAAGGEAEVDVKEPWEVCKEEGSQSEEGGGRPTEENPDCEAEEDSISTDSLTDDEMELHIRCVKSAHKQQLVHASLGNSTAAPVASGKRPSASRARAPPTTLSSISESVGEDGDATEEEPGRAETPGDHDAITEREETATEARPSSPGQSSMLGHLGGAILYSLLCVLFFIVAYHYDFLACFVLYLFSMFWLCFRGEKQRLQGASRGE